MKNISLVCSLFLCCSLQAQTYYPIPSHGDWRYRFKRIEAPGICKINDGQWMTKGTDTLINGKIYQIVYRRAKYTSNCNAPLTSFTCEEEDMITGFLRQDSLKVYFMYSIDMVEYLLYDFGADVGELFSNYFVPWHYVGYIDSVLIGNSFRKRINWQMVEGIGSLVNGLIPGQSSYTYNYIQLICFRDSGVVNYAPMGECYYIYESGTSSEKTPQDILSIVASPNPAIEDVTIHLNQNTFTHISIFNSLGQQVYAENNTFENEILLKQNYFPVAGIYYLLLSNRKSGISARLALCRM